MTMAVKNNKVVLGMSGGVDSTASAFLLKKRGFDVHGLYFDVFGDNSTGWEKAVKAAERLEIPIEYRDVSKEFRQKIISGFYNEYVAGRTPNPCIICNREIKFEVLCREADRIGAYYIATGHYAGISHEAESGGSESGFMEEAACEQPQTGGVPAVTGADRGQEPQNKASFICRAENAKKDQSYVLWKLDRDTLNRIIFPLSGFSSKEEIRTLLRAEGFECAEDKDSQEICFIENNDYVSFLTEKMGLVPKEGDFVDEGGNIVGRHGGIIRYTVGQRKGLGVTFGRPVFVTGIDAAANRVFLGSNEDLFKTRVVSDMNNFHIGSAEEFKGKVLTGKVRYGAPIAECRIDSVQGSLVTTVFKEAQRAVTPGQSIVWYDGDRLVGGGIIVRGEK